MFIRKNVTRRGDKTYVNYLLVESVMTDRGPRQRTVCSLGNLKPRPREEWLALVRRVERVLSGQETALPDKLDTEAQTVVDKIRQRQSLPAGGDISGPVIGVIANEVRTEKHRSVGAIHVGLAFYHRLGIDAILAGVGASTKTRLLTQCMVLNRLIDPKSELAMAAWINQSAIADVLALDQLQVNEDQLYRNMDRLLPHRVRIEARLSEREKSLFSLDDVVLLYDLTSSYFEGRMLRNPRAKRGYSRDHRPDCPQVVIGLVIDQLGFPRGHEVFDGNVKDHATVDSMLESLNRRVPLREEATVVVDRGMAYDATLAQIRARKLHYIVACRQSERVKWLSEFEDDAGWQEVYRATTTTNPFQRKGRVLVKSAERSGETYVLCLSEGRQEKDRAIREKQEKRFLADVEKLRKGAGKSRYKKSEAVHQAIGRLKERYPRVARYFQVGYDADTFQLTCTEKPTAKALAIELDGGYILKTSRQDLDGEALWRLYMLLTRVESAFRDLKTPLQERPIFHQLDHRAQTHIFLCVLAYHLLVSIEHTLRMNGDTRSWETVRQVVQNHQVSTVILPTTTGDELHIRQASSPEPQHSEIYQRLKISSFPMRPLRTWHARNSDRQDEETQD